MKSPIDLEPRPELEKRGKLDSLNQITPAIVAAARQMSARKAEGFIGTYLRADRRRHIAAFVQDVVRAMFPPKRGGAAGSGFRLGPSPIK
jgi:hypothetical protein